MVVLKLLLSYFGKLVTYDNKGNWLIVLNDCT